MDSFHEWKINPAVRDWKWAFGWNFVSTFSLLHTGQVAFHPVRIRYPNEIAKAFHGAGRTGPVHLHYRASGINLFGWSGFSGLSGLSGWFGLFGLSGKKAVFHHSVSTTPESLIFLSLVMIPARFSSQIRKRGGFYFSHSGTRRLFLVRLAAISRNENFDFFHNFPL